MNIYIPTLFGLESSVKEDLTSVNYDASDITVSDGLVTLKADDSNWEMDIARVNLWVRRGERVLFEVGCFDAVEFDEYFDKAKAIDWDEFIPEDYAFIVNGYSRKSKLFGITALQSLTKKAIVDSLRMSRGLSSSDKINEDSSLGTIKVEFGIVKDHVTIMIDSTGDGLHKRGYRPLTHMAPIRETLASGMVSLAHYKAFGYEALVDPFCGSGTILIEAALMACNSAPGKNRHFAFENIPYIGSYALKKAREEAIDLEDMTPSDDVFFFGSDIDKKAIESARMNAERAGVSEFIRFDVADAKTRTPERLAAITAMDRQLILTNPPYGTRLLTEDEANSIYKMIAATYLNKNGACKKGVRLSVISPEDSFEKACGLKADKRFKLYNGNIKCQLNNYFKLKR